MFFSLKEHPLTSEDEKFLSGLILQAASKNLITAFLMKQAIEDFEFDNTSFLQPLIEKKLLSESSYRPALVEEEGKLLPLMSSSEWLVGVFGMGETLTPEHVRIHMSFINSLSPVAMREPDGSITHLSDVYHSGKELWQEASSSLKQLLNTLDNAAANKQEVNISTESVQNPQTIKNT